MRSPKLIAWTLDRAAAITFEDHYITCNLCAEIVGATDQYVKDMKLTAERLRSARAAGEDA